MNRVFGAFCLVMVGVVPLPLRAVEPSPLQIPRPVLAAPDELFRRPNRYPLQRQDLDGMFAKHDMAIQWIQQGSTRLAVVVSEDRCYYYAGDDDGQLAAQYRIEAVWLDERNQPLQAEALGTHLARENPQLHSSIIAQDGTKMTRSSDFGMRVREIREKPAGAAVLKVTMFRSLPNAKAGQEFTFAVP